MTIEKVNSAITLIDKVGFERPYLQKKYAVDVEQLERVEQELEVVFPESYRYFLLNYGSGDFKGREFYGLIPGETDLEEIPNAFWFTKSAREDECLGTNLFVIEDLGDGVLACLDLSKLNENECPVVEFDSGSPEETVFLADSFGAYFYLRVKEAINEEG